MKIFFSAYHNPHFETVTEYAERALARLGHTVRSADDRSFLLPGRIRARFSLLHTIDLHFMNYRILQSVLRFHPDLFFVLGGFRIRPNTLRALRQQGIPCVLWTTDAPFRFRMVVKAAPEYGIIFCAGTEAMELLSSSRGLSNTSFLPYACDPQSHHEVDLSVQERKDLCSDIAFVGSYYENRAELLSHLTNFNLSIWGPGWEVLEDDHPLRKHLRGGKTKPSDWIKILSASKIVLISHYQDGRTPCYQASPKVFETLACRSFALVDDQRDVFKLFCDGRHLVKFSGTDDLKSKISWFLAHPEERRKIADLGCQEVAAKHTYEHRMRNMLDISQRLSAGKTLI